MPKSIKKRRLVLTIFAISFFIVNFCQAGLLKQDVKNKIDVNALGAAQGGGYEIGQSDQLLAVVQIGINAFLSLIGVILLVYLLSAGYKWMTAHGEEQKVEEAKDTIKRAITGAIIVVAAYAISTFVVYRLQAGILSNSGVQPPATQSPPASNP